MGKKNNLGGQLWKLFLPFAKFLLKSKLLLILFLLAGFGFWAGKHAQPDGSAAPLQELFENMTVVSYRDTPSDPNAHFVVELSARGKLFKQYDIDARRFMAPVRGHDYGRVITGSRYRSLKVRGHVDRGFWLELPDSSAHALLPDQFDELYRSTLDFVKPINIVSTVLGTLSGYSIGYRAATWSTSLANPRVQERILELPGIGRVIAREAWRRVLLEPVVMARESDADRFAAARGMQRIYSNFFRLALADSDQFIPQEAARLDSLGRSRDAQTMRTFVAAVHHAEKDTCNLTSEDFNAIEAWASLLDHEGHWAAGAAPATREERVRYYGTLAYYGLTPPEQDEKRIWMGPRLLVREGDMDGFVADDIPLTGVGCPIAWREWVRRNPEAMSANTWAAQWIRESRQLSDAVDFGRDVARKLQGD